MLTAGCGIATRRPDGMEEEIETRVVLDCSGQSLGFIRLVAFMESDLGIRVEDEELLAENFSTLRALDALIASKS
jgi:acyl carrier protein